MMQDDLRFVCFFDLDMMDLKALGRFRQKTIKQRTRLKIQLTTYVDQVFPEIQLEKIEAEMTEIMKYNASVIMTIPGTVLAPECIS